MKQQSPVFTSTLHCILAGFFSGFFFNIIMIFIIMLLSDRLSAAPLEESMGDDIVSKQTGDVIPVKVKPENVKQGTLLFKTSNNLSRDYTLCTTLDTDVHIQITSMIARATVKQIFHNNSTDWQEGIYVFPLPENAAVDRLRMHIGDRIIEGQIKEKQQARKEYQQAKTEGKRASLVEQERPNIFTTSVANIAPGEDIMIEITYQQPVRYQNETFNIRFPMVVAPRYIPGKTVVTGFQGTGWSLNTDQVADASRITAPVINPDQELENEPEHTSVNPVSLSIDLDAGFLLSNIDSPYHPIDIGIPDKTRYSIQLQNKRVPANRDFVLDWKAEAGKAPMAALFTEEKDSDIYSLIMLLPPASETSTVLHREVIYVIDTSGSMSGPSIVQAKQALNLALDRLKPGDRFNIIQFNSYTEKLFQFPQPLTHHSLRQAHQYVDSLEAQGGTEMAPALSAALLKRGNNDHNDRNYDIRQVIFLTDGSIGNEDALFNIIQSQLGDTRLFTIGIGSAPNSHFMDRAAKFGRGTHTYIGNVSEIQSKMETLFSKLESPVLTNIHIQWPDDCTKGNCIVESWPQNIPDLYLGEPLLISTKSQSLPESLVITGEIAGETWNASLDLNGGQKDSGIPTIWARKKIAALMDQMRQKNKGQNQETEDLRNNIIETALTHHLVSKYTSLVAVDVTPARSKEALLDSNALPVNLPKGWDHKKVFGQLPATATNAPFAFLSGLLMLFTAWFLCLTRKYVLNV
jgi:Ca-activated chloride channel family protein